MRIKGLIDEDFVQYKVPSMTIMTCQCSFKCDKECGMQVCQNSKLATANIIDIDNDIIVDRYVHNPITSSIVFSGLEPFDTFDELFLLITAFREKTDDDIIIYTGYNKEEIMDKIEILKIFNNIIIKFGRFIPNQNKHYDTTLGVELASNNQYAERIS